MHLVKASEHHPALMHKFFTFICNKCHKLELLPLRRSRSGLHQCWLLLAVFVWVLILQMGRQQGGFELWSDLGQLGMDGTKPCVRPPSSPKHKNAHLELLRIWGNHRDAGKMSCVVFTVAV